METRNLIHSRGGLLGRRKERGRGNQGGYWFQRPAAGKHLKKEMGERTPRRKRNITRRRENKKGVGEKSLG